MSIRRHQNGSLVVVISLFVLVLGIIGAAALGVSINSKNTTEKNELAAQTESTKSTPSKSVVSQDEAVKSAISQMAAYIEEYRNNNNGKLPLTSQEVETVNSIFIQLKPHPVNHRPYVLVQTAPKDNEVLYLIGRKCNKEDDTIQSSTSPRSYILQARLVSGALYCMDM
jgi:hypothetical protein